METEERLKVLEEVQRASEAELAELSQETRIALEALTELQRYAQAGQEGQRDILTELRRHDAAMSRRLDRMEAQLQSIPAQIVNGLAREAPRVETTSQTINFQQNRLNEGYHQQVIQVCLAEEQKLTERRREWQGLAARGYLNQGDAQFEAEEYQDAETSFRGALRWAREAGEEELVPLCLHDLGASVGLQRRYDEAIRILTEGLKRWRKEQPKQLREALVLNCAAIYTNRGIDRYKVGRYSDAIADYTEAIKLDPNYALAYYNRGLAFFHLGQYHEAIADNTKATQLAPNDAATYYNRGNAYFALGQYHEAIADYTQAVQRDPYFAWAYHNRGDVHACLGHPREAIADWSQAIELGPNDPLSYSNRGHALAAFRCREAKEAAIHDLEEALRLGLPEPLKTRDQDFLAKLKGEANP